MKTIWITGIGIVSPIGIGIAAFQDAVTLQRSGIDYLTLFEPAGPCEHAAEVSDGYDWKQYLFSKQTYADRCTQLALGAARLALEDAGISLPISEETTPIGLTFGTEWGCLDSAETFFEPVIHGKGRSASSLVFSHSYPNCPTSFLAIELGLRGYSTSFTGDSHAGLWALRSGFDALQSGTATRMLVGAADALSPVVEAHAAATSRLPNTHGKMPSETMPDAELWSRVPGEASVCVLLETKEYAEAEGHSAKAILANVDDAPYSVDVTREAQWGNASAASPLLQFAATIVSQTSHATLDESHHAPTPVKPMPIVIHAG